MNMNIVFHVCNVTKIFATGAFSHVIETFVHFLEETGELGIGRECRWYSRLIEVLCKSWVVTDR